MKSQVKKFMSAYKFWWTVLSVFLGLYIVAMVIATIMGDSNEINYVVFVIVMAVFLAGFGLSLLPKFKSKKFYENIENSGLAEKVEADFEGATVVLNGKVRLGENWIFVKGKERLLEYEDICQVYQYIHKTNFVENERSLKYVNRKGKTRVLCQLKLRGESDYDVQDIVGKIYSKNPNVKIGYR